MSRSESIITGVWKRSARSKRWVRHFEAFGRVGGEQQDVFGIAVRGVGTFEDVALLSSGRHARRRADTLHVDDHGRNFRVVGEAHSSFISETPGPAVDVKERRRSRCADDHGDGGQFILGLEDDELLLPVSGSFRYISQNSLKRPSPRLRE